LFPTQSCTRGSLEAAQFSACGHERKPPPWSNQSSRRLNGQFHSIDGAKGDAIELRGKRLGAAGMNRCGDFQDTDGFLQKSGLLALRFGQGHGYLGTAEGDGNARESRAGAKVKQTLNPGGKSAGAGDRLDKMAGKNAVFITNGGEIDAGIPAEEKR
jgi:hypothetical protein